MNANTKSIGSGFFPNFSSPMYTVRQRLRQRLCVRMVRHRQNLISHTGGANPKEGGAVGPAYDLTSFRRQLYQNEEIWAAGGAPMNSSVAPNSSVVVNGL